MKTMTRWPSRMAPVGAVAVLLAAGIPNPATAGDLIQNVTLSSSQACIGELLQISVQTQHPSDPNGRVDVWIDGWPGAPQHLQFYRAEAARRVVVFARTPEGLEDSHGVPVDVVDCDASYLRLLNRRNPYHRYAVDFWVKRFSGEGRGEDAGRDDSPFHGGSFFWVFGDGKTAVTAEPFVSHEYAPAVQHQLPYTTFEVSVTEISTQLTTKRRIALASSFDLARSMGFVEADIDAKVSFSPNGAVNVSLEVRNHHSEPAVFGRYFKLYLPCDPAVPFRWQDVSAVSLFGQSPTIKNAPASPGVLTIPPRRKQSYRISFEPGEIPPSICGIGYKLVGATPSRQKAYASTYFQVRNNPLFTQALADEETRAALKHLEDNGLLPNPDRVTEEDLYYLEQRGRIARTPAGWKVKP